MNNNPLIYLNTAAVGLLSRESVDTARAWQEKTLTNPAGAFFEWLENDMQNFRNNTGKLMGTDASNIAFVPNFSFGLQSVIANLTGKINKVLLYKNDYPSLNLPFELGDFEVHYVDSKNGFDISVDDIKENIEANNIELLAVSHVQFLNGYTLDIESLSDFCKEKGVIFILDATQTLGAVPLNFDALSIDVLISSSYKWLNGGMGSAVMAVKKDFLKKYPPKSAGFGSMTHTEEGWYYEPSALSFEPGHLNVLGLLHLQKAIEQRLETGVEKVYAHNQKLLKHLAEGLNKTEFTAVGGNNTKNLSTILCIEALKEVGDYLANNNVMITWRKGKIRVSPHFYNTIEEIDILIKLLIDYSK